MPEVFLLCEYASLNGGERSMLATFDGLCSAGFTPVVLAPPRGPLADAVASRRVELIPFECQANDSVRVPQAQLRENLDAILRSRRPLLFHANSLAMGRLSGPVVLQSNLPSIGHIRDIVKLSRQAVADVNCHARLIAVSQAVRTFHCDNGLHADKIHVVYNGVDLDAFRPRPPTGYLHQELGLPSDAQLIGTVGQIGLRKGQDTLLQAVGQVILQLPKAHFVIVGERNSQKDESRRFEQALHERSNAHVHFLGVRTDVCRLLNEWTLLVHPARQEPLGRVLLEAAASGVPVIASEVGGTSEIFPSELDAARLVPPDAPEALADAILSLLGDASLRKEMAAAARLRAETQFDIQIAAKNLLRHYSEFLL